jgi:hypothetical protein
MAETVNSGAHTYFKKQTTIPGSKTVVNMEGERERRMG